MNDLISSSGEWFYTATGTAFIELVNRLKVTKRSRILNPNTVLAPAGAQPGWAGIIFPGSCNPEVVNMDFEPAHLPALPPGSVIVPDNARFHPPPTPFF